MKVVAPALARDIRLGLPQLQRKYAVTERQALPTTKSRALVVATVQGPRSEELQPITRPMAKAKGIIAYQLSARPATTDGSRLIDIYV
jgi:hypothetical protein